MPTSRHSDETERTRVPTRANSCDHLSFLQREGAREAIPSRAPGVGQQSNGNADPEKDVENGGTDRASQDYDESDDDMNPDHIEPDEKDPNLVVWDGPDDPENPQNWSYGRKWLCTFILCSTIFCVTLASSVFSTATFATAEIFHVSPLAMTLGTSLFVLGFAFGPILWGPLSELFGRRRPFFMAYFIFVVFQIATAVSENVQSIMLTRFFGGLFGVAPLAVVGGVFVDIFGPVDRGVATVIYVAAGFTGAALGPVVGGFITQSYLGWRWTAYITAIMALFFGTLAFLIVPESHHPTLLQARARKLRYATRNWAIHSKADEYEVDIKLIAHTYLLRPLEMSIKEPILVLFSTYLSLVYGILYLFFEAFPISFLEERGWNDGVSASPFISITIGAVLGSIVIAVVTKTRFARKLEKHGYLAPEERLPPMIVGGFMLPIGLFCFAWTSNPNITWIPQVISGIPTGMGILMIFIQGMSYIIDVYMMHANSAIAANSFLRSLAGAGFPLFASAMFHNLGVPWATSVLAFICVSLVPVPICFYIWGPKLRSFSKFSPNF